MIEASYAVTVKRELIAQHFLIGGDWGRENELNSHRYEIVARYEGPRLDEHGYLLDIDEVNRKLDAVVERYRDRTLNDFAEFAGLNPSVEHFAQILAGRLAVSLPNVHRLEVTVWEDGTAGASYRCPLADAP
jgi:6-pyruvoyltetrahydropterin/6-carboxytetrahydropterin synthase